MTQECENKNIHKFSMIISHSLSDLSGLQFLLWLTTLLWQCGCTALDSLSQQCGCTVLPVSKRTDTKWNNSTFCGTVSQFVEQRPKNVEESGLLFHELWNSSTKSGTAPSKNRPVDIRKAREYIHNHIEIGTNSFISLNKMEFYLSVVRCGKSFNKRSKNFNVNGASGKALYLRLRQRKKAPVLQYDCVVDCPSQRLPC